ncbi:type VII secretion system-associated protein [Nocardia sp. CC201C]|uniref:type VII secretion system-associated protein n=1 Tax=Nocardia sp. CC201C TaxID=3044575 RepID=UPI0024A7C124|nr:type VII secretion system-associated protein [Nocardia sp. CC201C]
MNESVGRTVRRGARYLLVDPQWTPQHSRTPIPDEMIVGSWGIIDESGTPGLFHPNPQYRPAAAAPTDPIDAVLWLMARGADLGAELVQLTRDAVVEIGCDESKHPLIGAAPDGAPCVPVITSPIHKQHLDDIEHWYQIPGRDLPAVVPPHADILLNPCDNNRFRLLAAALRRAGEAETRSLGRDGGGPLSGL